MIIIYGGAFNPPTKAHYLIAKELIEKFKPDTFYFLPVGEKYNKPGMASFKNRFNMAESLIAEFKFIILTRKGFDVSKLIEQKYYNHKENFHIVNVDLPISSTEFRNKKNKEILIDEVYEYIKSNNLYEVNEDV